MAFSWQPALRGLQGRLAAGALASQVQHTYLACIGQRC
jgi:hypothetical protein